MFILLRVVVNVVINVVIVFIAVVITIIAFFVIKAIKAFRLIFFTTRIIFYRTTPALGLGTTLLLSLKKDSQREEQARKGCFSSF